MWEDIFETGATNPFEGQLSVREIERENRARSSGLVLIPGIGHKLQIQVLNAWGAVNEYALYGFTRRRRRSRRKKLILNT